MQNYKGDLSNMYLVNLGLGLDTTRDASGFFVVIYLDWGCAAEWQFSCFVGTLMQGCAQDAISVPNVCHVLKVWSSPVTLTF